jgi:hypothetical protein
VENAHRRADEGWTTGSALGNCHDSLP